MTEGGVTELRQTRPAPGVIRDWLRVPGGKAAGGLIALAIGFIFWQIFKWGGPNHETLISDVAFLPVSITGAIFAWRAGRHSDIDARTRRAWTIVAAAFFLYWLGDLIFTLEENLGSAPYPSLADAAYLLFYVTLLWGVLSFPTAPRTRNDRATLWLDTGTVMLGAFMILWYFALGPTVRSTGASALETSVSVGSPGTELEFAL